MKRFLSLIIITSFVFCSVFSQKAEATSSAKSEIVIDAVSGQVIFEKNADEQLDIAGASKIMSQLIFMDAIQNKTLEMEQQISVSSNAAKAGGMSVFLAAGEVYSASELLKASFVVSANDATMALAETVGGNQATFLEFMQEKSKELEINPLFVNLTGHNAQGQKMSAREAAKIAQKLIAYPQVLEFSKRYTDFITHPSGRKTQLTNPNKMVRFYDGCDGIATGSSKSAGYSGVFTAVKNERRVIAVVIGAKNNEERTAAAKALLDDVFNNYVSIIAIKEGKGVAKDVPVQGGIAKSVHGVAQKTLTLLIKKGEENSITKRVVLDKETLVAPVEKGEVIGKLIIEKNNEEVAKVNVVAYEKVQIASIKESLNKVVTDFMHY